MTHLPHLPLALHAAIVICCIGLLGAGSLFYGTGQDLLPHSVNPDKSFKPIKFYGANGFDGSDESSPGNRSVKFVRTIDFRQKNRGKNLKTFLFGKSKKKEIKPSSICRLSDDRLCVTDTLNGALVIIDNMGKIKKILTHIKGIKLLSPVCACSDDRGNLYVSDSSRYVVLKFNPGYKFQGVFISPTRNREQDKTKPGTTGDANSPLRITGMVFCRGTLYGVDTPNHRVLGFNRQGELTLSLGKRGIAPGEFNFPTHIAGDDQYIYITDAMNFRVQVFDHSGTFIRAFGSHGRGGGNFSKPKGIAVDRERHIFVADVMFDNIQIFSFQGQFLSYFGGPGQQNGEFWMPTGIMVDHDNTIWTADTYNNRIQIFHLVEKTQ